MNKNEKKILFKYREPSAQHHSNSNFLYVEQKCFPSDLSKAVTWLKIDIPLTQNYISSLLSGISTIASKSIKSICGESSSFSYSLFSFRQALFWGRRCQSPPIPSLSKFHVASSKVQPYSDKGIKIESKAFLFKVWIPVRERRGLAICSDLCSIHSIHSIHCREKKMFYL